MTEWLRDEGYDPDGITAFETEEIARQTNGMTRIPAQLKPACRLWMQSFGVKTKKSFQLKNFTQSPRR
jgi:hypothetical protein